MNEKFKKIFSQYFKESNLIKYYDFAFIGSNSIKDFDLVVIDKRNDMSLYEKAKYLEEWLYRFIKEHNLSIIVKHEHRAFINNPKNLLHFLFYPSYTLLQLWELPSFLASLSDTGSFIPKKSLEFQKYIKIYEDRGPIIKITFNDYHFSKYNRIAFTNIIYILSNQRMYSISVFLENLKYIYRFTLIEFINTIQTKKSRNIWTWDEIILFLKENNYNYEYFNRLLKISKTTESELFKLFLDYLKVLENGFESIPLI